MHTRNTWNTQENAQAYLKFNKIYNYYKNSARKLVKSSDLQPGWKAADLGCGIGISTLPIVDSVGSKGSVIAIDPSRHMLDQAIFQSWPNNVNFVHGTLSDLDPSILPLDAVIANSVVWLAGPRRPFFTEVYKSLNSGGRFAFSLPCEYAGEVAHMMEPAAIAFQMALQEARETISFNPEPPNPTTPHPTDHYSLQGWKDPLLQAGFTSVHTESFIYTITHEEWLHHLSIPAILLNLLPGVGPEVQKRFLQEAHKRITPQKPCKKCWFYFIAEKK